MLDFVSADAPVGAADTVQLTTNHTLAGFPGRFRTGPVQISDDDEWRSACRSAINGCSPPPSCRTVSGTAIR